MTVAESQHNSELASVTILPLQVLICVTDYPIIIDTSGSLSACQFELVSCCQTDSMNWFTQACEEFVLSGSHATKPNSSSLTCLAMLNHDFTVAPAAACSEHWLVTANSLILIAMFYFRSFLWSQCNMHFRFNIVVTLFIYQKQGLWVRSQWLVDGLISPVHAIRH